MKILKKDLINQLKESNKSRDIVAIQKCIYVYMLQCLIKTVAYVDNIKDYVNKFVDDCNLFNNMVNDLTSKKIIGFDNYFKNSPLVLYSRTEIWNQLSKLFKELISVVKQPTNKKG